LGQITHDKAHASHSEVTHANLKEEMVMDIQVTDHNHDLLAIVPYMKPNSPFPKVPGPHVEKLFLYQVIKTKAVRWELSYFRYCRCYFHNFNINFFLIKDVYILR